MTSWGISKNSLTKLKRPTTINLNEVYETCFYYFDRNIFEPFLLSNAGNKLQLYNGLLDCSDCKNYWLQNYQNQVINSRYSNGNPLNDPDNFIGCKDSAFNSEWNGKILIIILLVLLKILIIFCVIYAKKSISNLESDQVNLIKI